MNNTKNMEERYLGEKLKIKLSAKVIQSQNLADMDWVAYLWCSSYKAKRISKSEAIPLDDGSYALPLDTMAVGVGVLRGEVIAQVKDGDFDGGYRPTIGAREVGVKIIKSFAIK